MFVWRIKSQGNEEARQQFLEGYVPQIWELGLTVPDPNLRRGDDGVWELLGAGLGEAEVGRHRPRSSLAGPARLPRPLPRAGAVGARRSGRLMLFEVFRQEKKGQPFAHAGSSRRLMPRSPTRGRASSTAGAASRRRSGSCRVTQSTR